MQFTSALVVALCVFSHVSGVAVEKRAVFADSDASDVQSIETSDGVPLTVQASPAAIRSEPNEAIEDDQDTVQKRWYGGSGYASGRSSTRKSAHNSARRAKADRKAAARRAKADRKAARKAHRKVKASGYWSRTY
jgi:hypothetical protein